MEDLLTDRIQVSIHRRKGLYIAIQATAVALASVSVGASKSSIYNDFIDLFASKFIFKTGTIIVIIFGIVN